MAELATEADALVRRVRSSCRAACLPCEAPLLTGVGGYEVGRSSGRARWVGERRTIRPWRRRAGRAGGAGDGGAARAAAARQIRASVRVPLLGERRWHPLIAYGVRAAVTVGAAMLVAASWASIIPTGSTGRRS
jgi:hypothetical protein